MPPTAASTSTSQSFTSAPHLTIIATTPIHVIQPTTSQSSHHNHSSPVISSLHHAATHSRLRLAWEKPKRVRLLRVAKLEKDVSELKKIDHSAKALATKVLQRHTADLIQKYSVKPALESSKIQKPTIDLEQESKKSASEILKIKRGQAEKQKKPKHDKGVADTVKDHNRKHNNNDDDEEPSAGPNQGKKTKRRRTKESESSKKPSTTKETTKGKAPIKGSKTSKSASVKELVEEPIAEVVMDDAVNTASKDVVCDDDQPQDILEPKKDSEPGLVQATSKASYS
ncbi:hypothetical protein Tco_0012048 [Tanacetum coccineum]